MPSAEGVVVEVGGNEINERDVFYAPFTCESEQDFQIERSNQTASRNNSILKRTHPLESLFEIPWRSSFGVGISLHFACRGEELVYI